VVLFNEHGLGVDSIFDLENKETGGAGLGVGLYSAKSPYLSIRSNSVEAGIPNSR